MPRRKPSPFPQNDALAVTARLHFGIDLRNQNLRELTGDLIAFHEKQNIVQRLSSRGLATVQQAQNETTTAAAAIETKTPK
jgi:hypothetical protein